MTALDRLLYQLNCQVMNEHYGQIWNVAFGEAIAPDLNEVTYRLDGTFLQ